MSGYSDAELALIYTQGTNVLQSGLADEIAGNTGTGTDPRVGDIIDAFGTQGTTTAGEDGILGTEDDVVVSATGIYGIIDQVAQGVLTNEEAIAALQGAVGVPATYAEDGVTVLTPATGIYAQSGTGVNAEVLTAINAVYDYVGQADFASNDMVQEVANILGKPAELVTQADIDAVNQMVVDNTAAVLAGNEVNYDARYDLNNDGIVNYLDDQLFNELYAGEDSQYNTYVQGIDPNSVFADTGLFGTVAYDREQNRLADIALQEEIDTQAEIDAQIQTDINTQIATNAKAQQDAEKRSLLYALAADQGNKPVPEPYVAPFKQRYNWESIFSSEQEESDRERISPYGGYRPEPEQGTKAAATGGLITDESDELLAMLGVE